jgi:VIT1/CCC1 family predicted Fe2+/Mn2+ transporter
MADGKSDKSNVVALVLYLIVGPLGAHRFYVGKIATGVAQLLGCIVPIVLAFQLMADATGGTARPMALLALAIMAALVIWVLVDGVQILRQKFTDSKGNTLRFS